MQNISFAKYSNEKRCLICCRKFTNDFHCTTHIKFSQNDRLLDCRHCYKTYKPKGKLTRHQQINTGVRPCKCDDWEGHSNKLVI